MGAVDSGQWLRARLKRRPGRRQARVEEPAGEAPARLKVEGRCGAEIPAPSAAGPPPEDAGPALGAEKAPGASFLR